MSEKLFDAIAAGDEDAVRELLVEPRPELAGERNEAGLTPVLHALYNRQRPTSPSSCSPRTRRSTSSTRPPAGRTRGMEELLDAEPGLARDVVDGRLHGAPLRRVLRPGGRGADPARARGGGGGRRPQREHPRDAAAQRRRRLPRRGS